MAETIRIEIPIETKDKTQSGIESASKNLEKLKKSADSVTSSVTKANTSVTQFDKQAEKTQKTLAEWAKEKYEILLEAKDKISPILETLGGGLKSLVGKTWSVTMKAIDLVTAPVRGIINLLKNPIFQVGATLGITFGIADSIETYKDFEAAMSQVQAVSGSTSDELVKLTAKAKEMGATTKFTAEEAAEAFNYMAMAGWKTDDMLGGIEGILNLAAASGEELGTTSDIVTDALTAFGMQADDAGMFADVLAQAASNANTTVSAMGETFKYAGAMAGSLGYSIQDVALMTGLMANSGIKGSMAGTSLNMIFTRLSTNTAGAADKLKELGIEFFDETGTARDLSDVIEELRKATSEMTDEQKVSIANTIAGTASQKGLLSILNATTDDYNKLSEAINNADGAALSMSETMLDNLSGSITLLQSALDGVKIAFGERLTPYIRSLADWLTEQMPAISDALDELMDFVDSKVDSMQRKLGSIMGTDEWNNADLFGKAGILWDEMVYEPFIEWWNSTGKPKFAQFARNIGDGIGSGIKSGVLALLGIDLGDTVDEGASIGASFAMGFSEGFDWDTISAGLMQGFGNLVSSASALLPGGETAGLSSLMSAWMLSKLASPVIGLGKGAASIGKGLFGKDASGVSLAGMLMGSASAGTGLLGGAANLAITLGAGNLAGGASLGAGSLAALGLGAAAGGIAGGASLISGLADLRRASLSTDEEEKAAYGSSASWKVGGVAAGAATGALIGSVVPVIGTAVGALAGAGVGGIAGWVKGNKVKEEYQQNLEEMQAKADQAQKIFEATGLQIEDVTFKNSDLQKAMEDTALTAEELGLMFREECANVAVEAFGDIKLSLSELEEIAGKITFGDMAESLDTFEQAASDTDSSLSTLKSTLSDLKRENWKASLGLDLTDENKDDYRTAIDSYVQASKDYIDNSHYKASVAMDLIFGDSADSSGLDTYYGGLQSQVESLYEQLDTAVEAYLSGNPLRMEGSAIELDAEAEVKHLQEQIAEITDRLATAQTEAKLESLKIKYSGAGLSAESFAQLQEELALYVGDASGTYDEALEVTLTNLKLQFPEGGEEYDKALQEATEGYHAQIDEMNARVTSFNLETIAEAWGNAFDDYMPDLEGTTAEKLQEVLENAIGEHPDITAWTAADLIGWVGLDDLDLDTAEQYTVASELLNTVLAMPDSTLSEIKDSWKEAGGDVSSELIEECLATINDMTFSTRLRSGIQTQLDAATAEAFTASPSIEIDLSNVKYPNTTISATGHAAGGYVSSPELSLLGEEGYGEFVIPTNPSRRSSAIELYKKAGAVLGVSAFAEGGLAGGAIDVSPSTDKGSTSLHVSVTANPVFEVNGTGVMDEDSIVDVIRRHMKEMADDIGGEIAVKLGDVFSNMPLKEA